VIPVIIYSDETQSRSLGSYRFYPIYITLGNIKKEYRQKENSYYLLGYLPILIGTKEEKKKWSDECVKGQIMHAALKEIFSSIIQPGKSGVQLLDADGNERLCYPYFAYYIADWPGSRVTLTKDGKMTNLPCHGCLVTLENLGVLNNTVRSCSVRTHDTVINLYEEAAAGNATQKKALAKKHSFHPHKNFLGTSWL